MISGSYEALLIGDGLSQLVTENHRQEDTKHRQEDIACLRKVIRRLANGEFKGMSLFS